MHDNRVYAIGIEGAKEHTRGVRQTYPRRRCSRAARWLVVGVALVSTPLGAQQGQDEADRLACFRIRPLPACRGYWLVEVQGVVPIASTKQTDVFRGSVDVFDDNNLEFNLGYMLNVSRSLSGGGAIVLGSGSGGIPDGARARLRWWTREKLSLELEGGILRTNLGSWVGSPLVGPSIGVRANLYDIGALLVRYDRVEVPADEPWAGGAASGLSLGASASSGGALVVSTLIGLGLVLMMFALSGGT